MITLLTVRILDPQKIVFYSRVMSDKKELEEKTRKDKNFSVTQKK